MARAQPRALPVMASSGKPTPLNAKAGADSRPVPDSAVRSESVTPASAAPAARLSTTRAASPTPIHAMLPATLQPRSCAKYSKAAMPLPQSSTAGSSSLPNRAAATLARLADCPSGLSHSPKVCSRSSRPTDQAPAVMARIWISAGTSVAARNCS